METPIEHVRLVRFGPFEANFTTGELRKHGIRLKLQDQPLQVLKMLLARPGQLVTREEIRQTLWPSGTFVDFDNGLNAAVNRLREALGDSAENQKLVETLPRRGYRFIGAMDDTAPTGLRGQLTASPQSARPPATVGAADTAGSGVRRLIGKRLKVIAAASLIIAVIGAAAYLEFRRRTPVLTAKDTIVLADFTNSTGDPVFDGTLRQGLSVQLEQSPFLRTISDHEIQQTLPMMGQSPDAKLTPEIAREICLRTGSAAVLDGSIAQIGTQYLLTLKAFSCANGELLASTEAEGSDKSHVLDALGKATSEIRNKLGESLSTVQKFDRPLELATTSSLGALQAYSLGRKTMGVNNDSAAAVPFFQRAIRLDPNFAMAYARLGTCYVNVGQLSLGNESIKKAYELRERVSEREKFYIESHYYEYVTGDLEKAGRTYELWTHVYPRDSWPHANLGVIYSELGQMEKALEQFREAVRMEDVGLYFTDLAEVYVDLNRIEEAQATVKEAQAKNFNTYGLHLIQYLVAFLQDDAAGMTQQLSAVGEAGTEDVPLALEADTAAYLGRLGDARELSRRAVTSAERAEEKETAATYEVGAAMREALFGNAGKARQRAAAALALSRGRDVQCNAALVLAIAGDMAQAQALGDDLAKRFPEDTEVQFDCLPTLDGQRALSRNDASRAIMLLHGAAPTEMGIGRLYPVYVRGEAYLAAHKCIEAAAEFQKILEHRGIVFNQPFGALAHLELGRAYAMQGNREKAHVKYQDFLALWKDADPDLPILKQAKAEYAKL